MTNRWLNSAGAKLLHTSLPLIQAPMAGGATTAELVAAVCNASALGSLAAGMMSPNDIRLAIQKIRTLTDRPFSVNLFVPEKHTATLEQIKMAMHAVQNSCQELHLTIDNIEPPFAPSFDAQIQVLLEEQIPIFSFTFGIPEKKYLDAFKKAEILVIGAATNLAEATCLAEKGVDAIIAQGSEAGGHRGTFLGQAEDSLILTKSLVSVLTKQVSLPIIAAGGIMDGKDILSMLETGASAVQMGTAFLTCHESGIHAAYKKRLLNGPHQTTLTRVFSGKLARGIENAFISRMAIYIRDILEYPIQNTLTRSMRKEANKQNNTDFMSMWAGQSAHLCQSLSAGSLVEALNQQVQFIINHKK